MSCDKCEDIHIAQRAGKQNDECKCSCHSGTIDYHDSWTWNPFYPATQQPCTGDLQFHPSYTTCQNDNQRPYKIGEEKLP